MFDIVIIGYGKAGQLHNRILLKIQSNRNAIKYHDPYFIAQSDCIKNNLREIDLERINWDKNIFLDICTSTDRHMDWIEYAIAKRIQFVIIEKPLVTTFEDLSKLRNLPKAHINYFVVNYNYLLSPVLTMLQKLLLDYELTPKIMKTNFSKNRIMDSLSMRGADKNGFLLHNFFVEIPHQLSIAVKLFGEISYIISSHSEDMIDNHIVFKNHGNGEIKVIHSNGVESHHYSDLNSRILTREISIEANNDYVLKAEFGASPSYFGKVELSKNKKVVFMKALPDKSLDLFLRNTVGFFSGKNASPCSLDFAISINQTILEAIDKDIKSIKI